MKRYRYGNPSSQSFLQKARPYILIFVGWNLVGAMIWKFANSRAEVNDPDWFSRPQVDRIARLIGSSPTDTKKYSFSFISKDQSSDSTDS